MSSGSWLPLKYRRQRTRRRGAAVQEPQRRTSITRMLAIDRWPAGEIIRRPRFVLKDSRTIWPHRNRLGVNLARRGRRAACGRHGCGFDAAARVGHGRRAVVVRHVRSPEDRGRSSSIQDRELTRTIVNRLRLKLGERRAALRHRHRDASECTRAPASWSIGERVELLRRLTCSRRCHCSGSGVRSGTSRARDHVRLPGLLPTRDIPFE